MYKRKKIGQCLEHWGTPALTGYSWKDFPFRTTQATCYYEMRK